MLRHLLLRRLTPFLAAAPLLAWGPEGHQLVARIAAARLTPAASAGLARILGPGQDLVSVASWADEVRPARRETANWHFVDIPITAKHLDMARDCPEGDCIIARIIELRRAVADPATAPERRGEDLKFLIHFIADLHEPLHCADNEDRGGNTVRVSFFGRETNLHTVWDSAVLSRMAPAETLFPELLREAARHGGKWRRGTVIQWAEDSHQVARKVVYGCLPAVPAGAIVPLGPDYEKHAVPVVKEQLAKAGVRLAAVLNAILR